MMFLAMEWSPVMGIVKGTDFYGDPRGDELCVVAPERAVPADLCAVPGMRARAVHAHIRGHAVLVDHAAVFVHTGRWTVNPRTLWEVPTAPLPGRSTRWTTDRRLLKEDHVEWPGGVPVTTPVRTAADLLMLKPERSVLGVLELLRHGVDADEVIDFMGERFRGRDTWDASRLIAQLAVTGVRTR